jgi:hypothetical protein
MATTVGKKADPPAPIPTVPTAEAWRAMTPEQRLDFQVEVNAALSGAKAKKAEAAAQARGEATARARDVLTVLRVRGIEVPEVERERILAETDLERLERWLEKAVVAGSVADVLDEPS